MVKPIYFKSIKAKGERIMSKKYYFYARDVEGNYEQLFVSPKEVKVDGFAIIDNGNLEPVTVKVTKLLNEVNALTSNERINDIIDVIDMEGYIERKKAEVSLVKLTKEMESEIANIKMMETLKKHSQGSDKMAELYEQFMSLRGESGKSDSKGAQG